LALNLDIVGPLLKERREQGGLSLADVSNSLKLRKSMVEAIESADWTILPHAVYVKGYVKEYARFLGIFDNIVSLLQEIKEEPEEETKCIEVPVPAPAPAPVKVPQRLGLPRKQILFYASIAAVLVLFFVIDRSIRTDVPTRGIEKTTHVTTTAQNRSAEQQAVSETKKMMITCHERTWISVLIDGQERKEMMLNPQEILVLNGRERFDLLVGNAGGIKIFLNGKDTGFAGQSREVKRISLS
jgi:cytoskeletal protein RodZ